MRLTVFFLAFLLPFAVFASPAILQQTGNSGTNSERVTTLPINGAAQVVYSLDLGTIRTTDFLQGDGEAQFTTNEGTGGFNVYVGSYLILATSAGGTTGTAVSEANGGNITPAEHHSARKSHGTVYPSNLTRHYLNFVAYALSTSATGNINVDASTGRLSYQLFRNAGAPGFTFTPVLTIP
jgi:hypothetical protein